MSFLLLLLASPRFAAATLAPSAADILLYVAPTHEQAHVEAAVASRGGSVLILSHHDDIDDGDGVSAIPQPGREVEWAAAALPPNARIRGVVCGDDASLADAERLADALCPDFGNGVNPARRDKYLMNEALREHGVPAAAQVAPESWEEAELFLQSEAGLPVIVKPRRGVASIMVGLAQSEEEARVMYETLTSVMSAALEAVESSADTHDADVAGWGAAVVQEYLEGDEWIVDTVSRDGEHKIVALWRYDKGEANGAPFVYFGVTAAGMASAEASAEALAALVEYARLSLDALGWRWGPCHLEVKLTPHGPRLVEANTGRWNGIPFLRVAEACNGCNAYDVAVSAYLDGAAAWATVPATPPSQLLAAGRILHLVSHVEGSVHGIRHRELISRMPSLAHFQPRYRWRGEVAQLTTDFLTCAGEAHLVHADAAVVERDYRALREMQPSLFEVSPTPLPLYLRPGYVVRRLTWSDDGESYTDERLLVVGLHGGEAAGGRKAGGESGEDEKAAVLDLANDLAEGSMEGVESVSLVSAEGTHEAVEAALVCAPVYEVVSKT